MYDHYFSNFGRPPVLNDLSKDSAPRHPRFWRKRLLKVFIIYGHGSHLGQRTATILANFHTLNLRRLHLKFEQNWPRCSRGEVVWNSDHFSHTNAYRSKIGLPVKRSNVNVRHYFSNFGRPPVSVDICKDSATRHLRFWRRRFLKVFPIQRKLNLDSSCELSAWQIIHMKCQDLFSLKKI